MEKVFQTVIEFVKDMQGGLQEATMEFVDIIPQQITQRIRTINDLNRAEGKELSEETLQEYLNATNVDISSQGDIVIQLDPDSWLANAVEEGVKPWNMMDTHLRNAKISPKTGYRYKVIPLKVKKGSGRFTDEKGTTRWKREGAFDKEGKWQPGYNDKSKEMRSKLRTTLSAKGKNKPEWQSIRSDYNAQTGQVNKISRLRTEDKDLTGLYKIDTFRDSLHMASRTTPSKSRMVLFRTMTDNPAKGVGKWEHPGIVARDIFPKLEAWLVSDGEVLLEKIVENIFEKIMELPDNPGDY